MAGLRRLSRLTSRQPVSAGGGYIDCASTVGAANSRGLSVCEYVERIWDQVGDTDAVLERIGQAGALAPTNRVCEIGTGTGRYAERVLRVVRPAQYDSYETSRDWAAWLARTYGITSHPADGRTLAHTPDGSCGLVHAHGVFVYLPFLRSLDYFREMARICAPGGYVVFDCYTEAEFPVEIIKRWLSSEHRYPVILPATILRQFWEDAGFQRVRQFTTRHGMGRSRYFIFRRN